MEALQLPVLLLLEPTEILEPPELRVHRVLLDLKVHKENREQREPPERRETGFLL